MTWHTDSRAEPLPGQSYLGQQLGEVLLKGSKRGPAEGQVTGLGLQLYRIACGLDRILDNHKTQLSNPFLPGAWSWAR